MASEAVLDFDSLLAPVTADAPTGPDLRKNYAPDAVYRLLKDARLNARRLESRAIWDGEPGSEKPSWQPLLVEGPRVLATQSKDLEIAAWLTEALARERGFAGLRDGFRLCRELVERYWDALHPNPDPDEPVDAEEGLMRVAALAGLNGQDSDGTLIMPILSISILPDTPYGRHGVAGYDQAHSIQQLDSSERATRLEHGAVGLEEFQRAVNPGARKFYENLLADIDGALAEFAALCAALESRCGAAAPPSSNIRSALETCRQRVSALAAPVLGAVAAAPAAAGANGPRAGASGSVAASSFRSAGEIRSREEAFAALREVAHFFRQTEPQSFLPWVLDECVKWGKLPLPDLLNELISDPSAREALFKRVGIPLPPSSS